MSPGQVFLFCFLLRHILYSVEIHARVFEPLRMAVVEDAADSALVQEEVLACVLTVAVVDQPGVVSVAQAVAVELIRRLAKRAERIVRGCGCPGCLANAYAE